MSITKFSKRVLLVPAGYEEFKGLDNADKQKALLGIQRVLQRLVNLGFRDFVLPADDSLSVEVDKYLNELGAESTAYDIYPTFTHKFLLNNLIKHDRSELLLNSHYYDIKNVTGDSILVYNQLRDYFNKGIVIKEDDNRSEAEKLLRIVQVMLLKTSGYPVKESNFFKYNHLMEVFLNSIGMSEEKLHDTIRADLDNQWKWALNELEREDTYDTGGSEEFDVEDDLSQYDELFDILNITSKEKEVRKSSIRVDFDKSLAREEQNQIALASKESGNGTSSVQGGIANSVISDSIHQQDSLTGTSSENSLASVINLNRPLTDYSKEVEIYPHLGLEMKKIFSLMDKYSRHVLQSMANDIDLIVDLHIASSSLPSRLLPYKDTTKNKIILSVNIRMGFAEAYFRGQNYKLNPFFNNSEIVTADVLEW